MRVYLVVCRVRISDPWCICKTTGNQPAVFADSPQAELFRCQFQDEAPHLKVKVIEAPVL